MSHYYGNSSRGVSQALSHGSMDPHLQVVHAREQEIKNLNKTQESMKEGRNYTLTHYDDSPETFGSRLSYDDSRQHYPSNYDRTSQFGHSSSQFDRFSTRDPYSSTGAYQHQSQMTMQRSKEASKQMLYGVYGNVISILEEYERREGRGSMGLQRSNIRIPDQSYKDDEDIRSILETQLLLFENQLRACPDEAKREVRDELKKKTLQWTAVRGEHNVHKTATDVYVAQLFEILEKGRTEHALHSRPKMPITEETMRSTLPHILAGKHEAAELDRQFRDDRNRVAIGPDVRRSTLQHAFEIGGQRISDARSHLRPDVDRFVSQYRPYDNK